VDLLLRQFDSLVGAVTLAFVLADSEQAKKESVQDRHEGERELQVTDGELDARIVIGPSSTNFRDRERLHIDSLHQSSQSQASKLELEVIIAILWPND
jgi:hypothetical protein